MPDSKGICAVSGIPCVEITADGQVEIPGVSHAKNATVEHQSDLDTAGNHLGLSETNEADFEQIMIDFENSL
jgi:hypothetical protein